jgi:hypothetical protein
MNNHKEPLRSLLYWQRLATEKEEAIEQLEQKMPEPDCAQRIIPR